MPWVAAILRPLLFGVGTISLLALSWRSLRQRGSHGFYRFFAFEGILGLLLLNAPFWLRDPLAPRQVAAWLLLTASAVLAILGFRTLRVRGRPRAQPIDGADFAFERASQLVTSGVYRYLRHPLYASLLYLAWGALLKNVSWVTTSVALATTVLLHVTAKAEERENLRHFGPSYAEYARRTRRFVPLLW